MIVEPSPGEPLKCPSCRRENQISPERIEPARCSRCGCELEPLARIRDAADALLRQAQEALAAGKFEEAARLSADAWTLIPSPAAARSGLVAHVASGNSMAAAIWQVRLR